MKIVNRGFIINKKQLPVIEMPETAVPFKWPEVHFNVNLVTFIYLLICIAAIWLFFSIGTFIKGPVEINLMNPGALAGLIVGLICIPLQGIMMGRYYSDKAVINLYFTYTGVLVLCYEPVPKKTFIAMSLTPSIIVGWIPLLLSALVPVPPLFLNFLFAWGLITVLFSSRYYINVFCALRQMPEGSMAQVSGYDMYWFIPNKNVIMD